MYSMVLLMAITAGTTSADWRGCRGCGCYSGCHSCYSGCGCYSGCYTASYGCGCYGGCGVSCGGYSSCGVVSHGYHGCHSSCGGYGVVSHGYHGCGGVISGCGVVSHGCSTPVITHSAPVIQHQGGVIQQQGTIQQQGGKVIEGGKQGQKGKKDDDDAVSDTTATIIASVPADAQLKIDGVSTTSSSTRRVFVSPVLEKGKSYFYTFEAQYNVNGKPITVSKKVDIEAGKVARVDLNQAARAVASK